MTAKKLIHWYEENKRDLPWRRTKDPYKIWLSEIMLQQTRVAQGLPYYLKFEKEFPTVFHLAKAPERKVLKLWQGLGYYSRARNLHYTAKEIVKKFNGKFPATFSELKKLKGVGDYTAAAIASMSFNEPQAVVDGNVYRVLSRLFAIETPVNSGEGKKIVSKLANELIDKKSPGTFNQALMEFGATYCTPQNPACGTCVLKDHCASGPLGKAGSYPVKTGKTKIRKRYFEYFFLAHKKNVLIEKRSGNDIWKNLYQLPLLEFKKKLSQTETLRLFQKRFGLHAIKQLNVKKVTTHKKHLLSHQTILARFWQIESEKPFSGPSYKQVPIKNLKKFPFPVLIANHLKEITIFE